MAAAGSEMNRLTTGFIAGLIATVPMSVAMLIMFKQLASHEKYPLPPSEIMTKVEKETGAERIVDEDAHKALTTISHFLYGGSVGAIYGAVEEHVPMPAPAKGMLYGVCVWLVSYIGWLPAIGILKPATEHPPRRNLLMIAAHLIWGATAGMLVERMNARR